MDNKKTNKQTQINKTDIFDPVQERRAAGNAPVLVEIICERVHCVMYDYAINTVDMVAEIFGDQIDIQTIVRRGDLKNAMRFLKLCKKAGKLLTVPTILVNAEVAFTPKGGWQWSVGANHGTLHCDIEQFPRPVLLPNIQRNFSFKRDPAETAVVHWLSLSSILNLWIRNVCRNSNVKKRWGKFCSR